VQAAADVYKDGGGDGTVSSNWEAFYREMMANAASFVLWAEEVMIVNVTRDELRSFLV
jgi:hypothetical protein